MALRPRTADYPRLIAKTVGPVKVDLDDLTDLHSLLVDRTSGPVSIQVGKYQADDPLDFAQASDADLCHVRFTTASPVVRVFLTPSVASVSAETDDPATIRLVEDAAKLINQRPLSTKIAYPWFLRVLIAALAALVTGLAVSFFRGGQSTGGYVTFAVGFVGAVYMILDGPRSWRQQGAVEVLPIRRVDRRVNANTFRSNVAVALLSAILGAALGVAGTLITTYITK
jgi:hypothetical protein